MQLHKIRLHKKILLLLAGILLAASLTGCDNDAPAVQNVAEQNEVVEHSSETEPIEIVISHGQAENTPEDIGVTAMQAKLKELMGDRVTVTLYTGQQRGNAREQIEAVQLGDIHIAVQPAAAVSQFVDDMKVLHLPYLFSSNKEETIALLDGAMGQEVLERLGVAEQSSFTGMGLWFGGYKLFTSNGQNHKEIHSPADFCGLKIAVPDSSLLKAQYENWGAETVVLDETRLYSALEQTIADGCESTLQQIVENRYWEVQRNVVQAYHSAEIYIVLANKTWFYNLPADVQSAIIEAQAYGKQAMYAAYAEKEAAYLNMVKQAEGVRYYQLSPEELEVWKASVTPLYNEQLAGSQWQMNYVKRLQEQIAIAQ